MGKHITVTFILFLNLAATIFPASLACPYCPTPTPPTKKIPPPPPPSPPPPSPPPPVACPPPPPQPKPTPTPCPPPPPPPKPTPTPCPPPPSTPKTPSGACPIDTLKLSACVDLLGGLVHAVIGQEAKSTCCPLLEGVADLDAALCLCTTIRAKALSLSVVLPVALELLVNCGKHVPSDYQCPAY